MTSLLRAIREARALGDLRRARVRALDAGWSWEPEAREEVAGWATDC